MLGTINDQVTLVLYNLYIYNGFFNLSLICKCKISKEVKYEWSLSSIV